MAFFSFYKTMSVFFCIDPFNFLCNYVSQLEGIICEMENWKNEKERSTANPFELKTISIAKKHARGIDISLS